MKATIFNRYSAFITFFIIILIEYSLLIYFSEINNELVGYPLLLIVFTFIIFFGFAIKLYYQEIIFLIGENHFSIKYENEEFENKSIERYVYSNIKSYKIYFPSYKYSCLLIKYKNGKKREFCFIEKKGTWKIEHYNKEIIKSFHKQVQKFNSTQEVDGKIKFEKSFFGSNFGLIMVILLIATWILLFFLNILKHSNSKHFFQLFFLLLPVLLVVSQRKNAIDFYKDTIAENPLG
jgi:hypothetical protein